jgi:hypothetical protein
VKHPKVTERKLGRERALGQAFSETKEIEIDPRQDSKEYIDSLIHEWLHVEFPDWTERKVAGKSRKLSGFLWKHKLRIIRK